VASISRLLKIVGLFCKRALENKRYSAKETCDFKEPTNRSHRIVVNAVVCDWRDNMWTSDVEDILDE